MGSSYSEAYRTSDIGKSELPPHLAAIKPHITEPGKWDSLIEGYNNAIAAAEKCQFKGVDPSDKLQLHQAD
jgi:hypothetical protein